MDLMTLTSNWSARLEASKSLSDSDFGSRQFPAIVSPIFPTDMKNNIKIQILFDIILKSSIFTANKKIFKCLENHIQQYF